MIDLKNIFDKHFINDKYVMLFSTKTGVEIIQGINGHDDPFVLELPSLLDIGIMGTCVHKCKMCYQGHEDKPNMKLEDFKKIIDEVKNHVNQVALGGRGDPNKHENFKEIIEYCRENNIIPNYTTSGIDLTDNEIEISKECGAVAISMYEKDYTYKALNDLMDANIKTNIHFVFSSESYDKAMSILTGEDTWSSLIDINKLNAVIFLLFKRQGAAKDLESLSPTKEQLKTFSELIYKPECKFKVGMDSCLVNHTLKYTTPTKLQLMSIDTCEGARMSAYISPDMKFMPCSFADNQIWATSISDTSIKAIWENSPVFEAFRNHLRNKNNSCPLNL